MTEERVLWQGKPSYRQLITGLVLVTVLVVIASIPFFRLVFLAAIAWMFAVVWRALQIRIASYKITTKYVTRTIGIRRQQRKIPLYSISEVTIEKPVLMWILGCARIKVLSHGASIIRFPWLVNYEVPRGILELKARSTP